MSQLTGVETRPEPLRSPVTSTPVVRSWSGATAAERADDYLAYLEKTGLADFQRTPGNRGVLVLRREVDGRSELIIMSLWETEGAIHGFAGEDVHRAVFYPEDEDFLLARDLTTEHYEIAYAAGCAEALFGRAGC